MYVAKVHVTLRKSILDPQGKAVEHAVASLGLEGVTDVRIGKYIEFTLNDGSEQQVREIAEQVCRKLLANPVMEDYSLKVEKP